MFAVDFYQSLQRLPQTPCAVLEALCREVTRKSSASAEPASDPYSLKDLSLDVATDTDPMNDAEYQEHFLTGRLAIAYAQAGHWEHALDFANQILSPSEHIATMVELLVVAKKQKQSGHVETLLASLTEECDRLYTRDPEQAPAILHEIVRQWPEGHPLPESLQNYTRDFKIELASLFQSLLEDIDLTVEDPDNPTIHVSGIYQEISACIGEFSYLASRLRPHDKGLYQDVMTTLHDYIKGLNERWPAIDKITEAENAEAIPCQTDMDEQEDDFEDLADIFDEERYDGEGVLLIAQELSSLLLEHPDFFQLHPAAVADITGCIVRSLPSDLDPESSAIFDTIQTLGMCAGAYMQFGDSPSASINLADTLESVEQLIDKEAGDDARRDLRINIRTKFLHGVIIPFPFGSKPQVADGVMEQYRLLMYDLDLWHNKETANLNTENLAAYHDVTAAAADVLGKFATYIGDNYVAADHKQVAMYHAQKSANIAGADPKDSDGEGVISMLLQLSEDPDIKQKRLEILELLDTILFQKLYNTELRSGAYGAIYNDLREQYIELCASLGFVEKAVTAYCRIGPTLTDQAAIPITRALAQGLSEASVSYEVPEFP